MQKRKQRTPVQISFKDELKYKFEGFLWRHNISNKNSSKNRILTTMCDGSTTLLRRDTEWEYTDALRDEDCLSPSESLELNEEKNTYKWKWKF